MFTLSQISLGTVVQGINSGPKKKVILKNDFGTISDSATLLIFILVISNSNWKINLATQ